jgi:hypothetical protein
MRLRRGIAAGVLIATGLVVPAAASAAPAVAKKCDTNLYSDWMEGPGRITYQKTATSESNSSWSGDLGVSIPLVIAEIQNKYSKTVGKSHAVTDSWSYTAEVPANKVRRLHQLKQSWRVQVVRWKYTTSDCKKTKEVSNKTATFPTKNRDYMWILVGRE